MAEVDLELLITLVQDRPVLWDKSKDCYKDRILTRNTWIEVFRELNADFEEMGQQDKNELLDKITLLKYLFRDCVFPLSYSEEQNYEN